MQDPSAKYFFHWDHSGAPCSLRTVKKINALQPAVHYVRASWFYFTVACCSYKHFRWIQCHLNLDKLCVFITGHRRSVNLLLLFLFYLSTLSFWGLQLKWYWVPSVFKNRSSSSRCRSSIAMHHTANPLHTVKPFSYCEGFICGYQAGSYSVNGTPTWSKKVSAY